jgi:hypothetical protein
MLVVQVATPGLPDNEEGEHPVFADQLMFPIGSGLTLRLRILLIRPFSPVTVAVKVTD